MSSGRPIYSESADGNVKLFIIIISRKLKLSSDKMKAQWLKWIVLAGGTLCDSTFGCGFLRRRNATSKTLEQAEQRSGPFHHTCTVKASVVAIIQL
jgi:hypothetical protein